MQVAVIIPALNEAGCIGGLVRDVLAQPVGRVRPHVVVVDNGSSDDTGGLAQGAGACVVREPRRSYGYACAAAAGDAEVLVFLDGDYSSLPGEMPALLVPLREGRADLVLGSRELGHIAPGAMLPRQRFGKG